MRHGHHNQFIHQKHEELYAYRYNMIFWTNRTQTISCQKMCSCTVYPDASLNIPGFVHVREGGIQGHALEDSRTNELKQMLLKAVEITKIGLIYIYAKISNYPSIQQNKYS